jgi:DNA-directed RNA polymerase specialized sigma24 family protein
LDDIYKDIIYFKLVEEKNYKEISEILNLSQDNIRKRFER